MSYGINKNAGHLYLLLLGINMKYRTSLLILIMAILFGCGAENVLTKKEMAIQSKADSYVSGVLFEHDMTETASYNVRKNGSVAIKFSEDIPEKKYTKIVNLLRSSKAIDGVYAEQSGAEVCGLP